ncbi:MAG: DUF547 domain-containing protein [Caulobacterales bacterium]|uniref:DUF547 domain-containing protein n=1 Tax=Glycocaulis sp. TaxID=1969725 RepID=UPI003FA0179C
MPAHSSLTLIAVAALAAGLAQSGTAQAANRAETAIVAVQQQPMRVSGIDYAAFDDILGGIVFEAGRSNRMPARGRAIRTGTRINPASSSRYRYEGNRVVYHALTEDHVQQISAYREELEQLPSQIDFDALPDTEQLAYWLNLHNIVVIEQLAREYPVSRINTVRVGPDRQPLHDAQIINVGGRQLSLNQIRFEIVGQRWNNPLVIYGFFSGAVGGPSIMGRAFTGDRVWSQLAANAGEFINALRGVELSERGYEVSPVYSEWRETLFPEWPMDLRYHLEAYADYGTLDVDQREMPPQFLSYDNSIADITNGQPRCRPDSTALLYSSAGSNDGGANAQSSPCSGLPAHSVQFVRVVTERRLEFLRQGRLGSVTVRDIPTNVDGERTDERAVERVNPDGSPVEDGSQR